MFFSFPSLEVGRLDGSSTILAAANVMHLYKNLGIFINDKSVISYWLELNYFKVVSLVS